MAQDLGDFRIKTIGGHPIHRAALNSRLRLTELRGDHRERNTLAQTLNDIGHEATHLGFLPRIFDRNEDFGDQKFRFPKARALGAQEFIHLSV